jgi:hypothetical protein
MDQHHSSVISIEETHMHLDLQPFQIRWNFTCTLSISAGFGNGLTEILSSVITLVDLMISVRYR